MEIFLVQVVVISYWVLCGLMLIFKCAEEFKGKTKAELKKDGALFDERELVEKGYNLSSLLLLFAIGGLVYPFLFVEKVNSIRVKWW